MGPHTKFALKILVVFMGVTIIAFWMAVIINGPLTAFLYMLTVVYLLKLGTDDLKSGEVRSNNPSVIILDKCQYQYKEQ